MYKKISILLIALLLLSQCGFKRLDNPMIINITSIETDGYKRANYFIKNNLLARKNNKDNNAKINIKLETKREKTITEKNIKNEITKYNINIESSVNVYFIRENKTETFKISENGDYRIEKSSISSSKNLDNLERNLSYSIAKKIRKKIMILANDL
tara:strand:+ start:5174 stop:5641 length:468 start_codon:yes stop_codon:yes gene_type:complete